MHIPPAIPAFAVAAALLGGAAAARAEAPRPPVADAAPVPLVLLVPATAEYRWHFLVPEWTMETRIVSTRIYAPQWGSARVDYALPDFRTERRRIGAVPEFSCKYADLGLPNECRTTWHGVYVDMPVPVMARDHVDVDLPRWSWRDEDMPIDVWHLAWNEQTLIVSLPALRPARAVSDP